MKKLYGHPESLERIQTKYCAGCGHGVIHRVITEVLDELGIREKAIITNPVGCSIWSDLYFKFDSVQPAHGRTPAAATGITRVRRRATRGPKTSTVTAVTALRQVGTRARWLNTS